MHEQSIQSRVLVIVRTLAAELHPDSSVERLHADSSIDRDFGLDSLARVELAQRIERAFGTALPDAVLAEADTVAELTDALLGAGPAVSPAALPEAPAQPEPGAAAPPRPRTLLEAFEWHVAHQPDRTHILLADQATAAEAITYGALHAQAMALAAGLIQRGIRPGEAVAIMLPTGREFFAAFYGALYAQAVPVPLYPPARPSQIESHMHRIAGILANCEARVLLTFERARRLAYLLRSLDTKLETIATVEEISQAGASPPAPSAQPTDTAFLQYTSGSTGQPKGVVLSHANLLANLDAMRRATGVKSADRFVSWLPLYHDMGLIGACLGALVVGFPLVLMSPFTFLSHPVRWLRAIDQHRATLTAAPNFAYELCVNKIDDKELADLDLSTLRMSFNGAEAVSSHTIERFTERFARCGLRSSAITPVYGLAECALGLTFPPPGRRPLIDHLDRPAFLRTGTARRTTPEDPAALAVVSCGTVLPGHAIRIADAGGKSLPERTQGRIEFKGPSATCGYLNNPPDTERLFDGEWLDTGDLGYLAEGELYVTGRAKDVIIRGGHNIHPQELEEAIGRLPDVRKGGVVVFPATDRRSGTERVVVLAETRETDPVRRSELISRINRLAVDLIGLPVDAVELVPPRTVLKTSSGKIRRAASRDAYEQGKLGSTGRAPWMQLARLTLQGLATQYTRKSRSFVTRLSGVRALFVAGCLAPFLWLTLMLTPGLIRRRRASAAFVRFALRLCGISLRTRQESGHLGRKPRVFVSNHASYVDGVALITALPLDVAFVVKRELERSLLLGLPLKRLGCVFVERHDVHGAVATASELQTRLRARESLLVLAEGTFRRDPGLLPFHMGAFVAAAETGSTVVPVAVCGTRAMLPDGAVLPRPTDLELVFGEPSTPRDSSWRAAVELRKRTREYILSHIHEPDLEQGESGMPMPDGAVRRA